MACCKFVVGNSFLRMGLNIIFFNPFLVNALILYPVWFSGIFRRYKMGTLPKNGLRNRWINNKKLNIRIYYDPYTPNSFINYVEKWQNVLLKFCGVNTARLLKYDWQFFNIMHERVNNLTFHPGFQHKDITEAATRSGL